MKATLPNFDSIHPADEFLPAGVLHDHSAIVAFYVSHFASPRDAFSTMMVDAAHIAQRETIGDGNRRKAIAELKQLDADACYERNQLLHNVLADLKLGSDGELRHAKKNLLATIEKFREKWGCLPSQVESALRYVLTDEKSERAEWGGYSFTGAVTDLGPNPEPLVHAWVWMELIAYPLLIAYHSPDYFFNNYAPGRYDNFDVDDPYVTVRAWGNMAIIFNDSVRRSWKELSDSARRSIKEDAPQRVGADGAPDKIAVHLKRADFYAHEVERLRRLRPHHAARSAAQVKAAEEFNKTVYSIETSVKIARRLRRYENEPIDWLDFVL